MVSASRKRKRKGEMRMKFLRAAFIVAISVIAIPVYAQTLGTSTRIPEGTCGTGATGIDVLCANAGDTKPTINPNNAGQEGIPYTSFLTTTYTNATISTYTSITGLSFPISASRNYHAYCRILWQGSAATASPTYQFTGPSGAAAIFATLLTPITINSLEAQTVLTYVTTLANTSGAVTPVSNFVDTIDVSILNGANAGTVQLQAHATGSGTLTISAGSFCQAQ